MYIFTPGHQAASMGHIVLRMLGQSRRLQCLSLGMLSPLEEGKREERGRGTKAEERGRGGGKEQRAGEEEREGRG